MAIKPNGRTNGHAKQCVLTEQERVKLCVETGASMSTVRRWGAGKKVQPRTRKQLTQAARKLEIPVPQGAQ